MAVVEVVLVVRGASGSEEGIKHAGARCCVHVGPVCTVHVGPVCTVSAPQASVGGRPALVV